MGCSARPHVVDILSGHVYVEVKKTLSKKTVSCCAAYRLAVHGRQVYMCYIVEVEQQPNRSWKQSA